MKNDLEGEASRGAACCARSQKPGGNPLQWIWYNRRGIHSPERTSVEALLAAPGSQKPGGTLP
ncbi:MAG: hypothetical protein LC772_05350 [Chloroflexi bacterium]|nr:hypothetical protein [Chloroflexota bacterium]